MPNRRATSSLRAGPRTLLSATYVLFVDLVAPRASNAVSTRQLSRLGSLGRMGWASPARRRGRGGQCAQDVNIGLVGAGFVAAQLGDVGSDVPIPVLG